MCGRKGGGGEAGEQQIRAPGNPYFSFSSFSFSLCIRRGFDKKFRSRQCRTDYNNQTDQEDETEGLKREGLDKMKFEREGVKRLFIV